MMNNVNTSNETNSTTKKAAACTFSFNIFYLFTAVICSLAANSAAYQPRILAYLCAQHWNTVNMP